MLNSYAMLTETKELYKGGTALYCLRTDTLGDGTPTSGLADERAAKVRGCRVPADRKRSIAAGLLLEAALGREGAARVRTAPGGKPYIEGAGSRDCGFPFISVSHSGVWAVLAVSEAEVGVDIEQMREGRDFRGIARKAFALEGRDSGSADSCLEDCRAFYRMWTIKESYVKLLGASLAMLPTFRVRVDGGGTTARVDGDRATVIRIIEGIEGYALALATRCAQ
jgi:phosphopantetheinyl transferase